MNEIQSLVPLSIPDDLKSSLDYYNLSSEDFASIIEESQKALRQTSSNKAVFPLKDWEKNLLKSENPQIGQITSHSKWQSLRSLIVRQIGLVTLSPSQSLDNPWALYAPQYLIDLEQEMIDLAKRETDDHVIPQELIDAAFASRPTMAEEQKLATLACTTGNKAVMVTEGTAGAGKSFTLNAIREIYENAPPSHSGSTKGYDIIGTALSWTATKVLEASAGLSGGCAIQGLVMAMDKAKEKGEEFFKRRTILIVDEAGLVGTVHMHKLLWHAANSEHAVRVILTGDSLQLNPVMAGNALEAIVDECGSARLDTIRRQKQESHRNAVKHFCFGRAQHGLFTYWQQEAIHFCLNAEERREKVMQDYVSYCVSNPNHLALVLALENAEVKTLNDQIRQRLKKVGRLRGQEFFLRVFDGRQAFDAPFCVGDQIVLRKNDRDHPIYKSSFKKISDGLQATQTPHVIPSTSSLDEVDRYGIFNRMNGVILSISPHPSVFGAHILRILLGEGGETLIDTSQYIDEDHKALPITHNFATTIYASQGQTVEKVLLIDSPMMNRRLAYVGMSRHTQLCDIYLDCYELHERANLNNKKKLAALSPEHQANIALKTQRLISQELGPLSPKKQFKPSYFLEIMAKTWNKDSQNPTAWMARKRIQEKQEAQKKGLLSYAPALCSDDNPNDHPNPRFTEPLLFSDLQTVTFTDSLPPPEVKKPLTTSNSIKSSESATKPSLFSMLFKGSKSSPKPNIDPPSDPVLSTAVLPPISLDLSIPKPLIDHRESPNFPDWTTPSDRDFLALHQGTLWDFNRYGYPRLFGTPPDSYTVSRWSFDGNLMAGDGFPPIFYNTEYSLAPLFLVPDARAAILSYQFFRQKHAQNPEKIPHIIIAFPAMNAELLHHAFPDHSHFYCAWSPNSPGSFDQATRLAQQLSAFKACQLYPKHPPTVLNPNSPSLPRKPSL